MRISIRKLGLIPCFVLLTYLFNISVPTKQVQAVNTARAAAQHIDEEYVARIDESTDKQEVVKRLQDSNLAVDDKPAKVESKNWIKVKVKDSNQLQALKSNPHITKLERNTVRRLTTGPNDAYYNSQNNVISGQYDQWDLRKIKLGPNTTPPPATKDSGWEVTTGSSNTIVAVIDTGIDLTHPDLTGNIWINSYENSGSSNVDDAQPGKPSGNGYVDDIKGWNFADNNNNVQDTNGHGTHVAGTIAAVTDNTTGMAGICWTCKIMPLKVVSSAGGAYDSDIYLAIHYAVDNGAKLINMSLGGPGYSQILQDAIDYAWANDVLVISAAGNYGSSASDSYPGGSYNSISVGATDYNDVTQSYSNTGPKMDLVAPGSNILSTYLSTSTGCLSGSQRYNCLDGTSMAAPHVTGVAALIYDLHRSDGPAWTAKQIRYALLHPSSPNYIDNLGNPGFDDSSGYGRLNALKALQASTPASDNTPPTATLTAPGTSTISGSFNVTGTASDADLYMYMISFTRVSDNYIVKQVSGRTSVTSNTLYSLNTSDLPDDEYKVSLRVEDFAGNVTSSAGYQVTVDNTAPGNFTLSYPTANQAINTTRPPFTWNTPSDVSPLTYSVVVDGATLTNSATSPTFTPGSDLPQGTHSWYVVAKDAANHTTNSSTLAFNIDTVAPADFAVTVSLQGSKAVVTFSTSDDNSGMLRYDIAVDGASVQNVTSPYTSASLLDGSHTITVTAVDKAGNTKQATKQFTINERVQLLKSKADFNANGKVDISDLSILAQNWNKSSASGDANGDGKVDLSDLSILAQNWNKSF